MDWNLKGKGRTPHKDDKAASDYGVKQVILQEEPSLIKFHSTEPFKHRTIHQPVATLSGK